MIFLEILVIIFLHMNLVWLWYHATDNPSVVDVGWASGLTMAGLSYLYLQGISLHSVVLGLLLLAWGARLGGYLWWTRIRLKEVDKRYIDLSNNWKINKSIGFYLNFQLQGLFIFIIALPWYFISSIEQFSWLDAFPFLLFVCALSGETLADYQLQQFKKSFPRKVCQAKLWSLSRHPNYFFEWLIWCSFALFAFSNWLSLIAFISPLSLYLLMTKLTIPITEKRSLSTKGEEFRQYQQKTPVFFPKLA